MLFRKTRMIKIIRVADEQFNVKPYNLKGCYFHGPTCRFLNVQIKDLNERISATPTEANFYSNDDMNGCFCFIERFDEKQITHENGSLFFRKGHKTNYAYLPESEIVFVRNINASLTKKFVYEIQRESTFPEPTEGKTYYEWVKMPLSLALQRLNDHARLSNSLDERITEIYLTEQQVNKLQKETLPLKLILWVLGRR